MFDTEIEPLTSVASHRSPKQLINPNDYMVKLDLKDAYLTVGIHPDSQKYLRFIWQSQTYQFRPTSVYKITEACSNIPSHSGHQTADLFRRFSPRRIKPIDSTRTYKTGVRISTKPGVHNQLRKANADTSSNRVPGVCNQFNNHEVLFTSRENNKNISSMQILAKEQPKFITSTGSTTRFSGILSTSNMVGPPSLQTSTKLP